jgi:hypothetical protein
MAIACFLLSFIAYHPYTSKSHPTLASSHFTVYIALLSSPRALSGEKHLKENTWDMFMYSH